GWFLPRCPGRVGLYLGLTGGRLGPADMVHAGLASHYVPSARLSALLEALPAALAAPGGLDACLAGFAEPAGVSPLAARRTAIDRHFAGDSVEAILAAVEAASAPWAAETVAAIRPA